MTARRLALTLWGALFLAGLLAYLTRGPAWLLASLDDETEPAYCDRGAR